MSRLTAVRRTFTPTPLVSGEVEKRAPSTGKRLSTSLETNGGWWRLALPALLTLALALRLIAALQPGFHHPDAVYQYLEPAHRLLTGEGTITWEWRVGMRGWLLPWLFAAPMALGRALAPGSGLDLLLCRMMVALASLSAVWSAWTIGARVSRFHAALAGFVAATWFEAVHFGVQTMSEPLALAAMLPAAALLSAPAPRGRALAMAGALLGFAVVARPQYAPAAAILALVPVIADWRRLWPIAAGGVATLALGALADLSAGQMPFLWVIANVDQNLVVGRMATASVSPVYAYVGWWAAAWRGWIVVIALGAADGRRIAPSLLWAALAVIAVHTAIAHKEYRYVLFATEVFVLLGALGTATLVEHLSRHRRAARAAAFAGWGLASLLLAFHGDGAAMRVHGRAGTLAFRTVAADPSACGLVTAGADFAEFPARSALRDDQRLGALLHGDPAPDRTATAAALARHAAGYDRIVAPADFPVPAGYARGQCVPHGRTPLCVFARPGDCTGDPLALNKALADAGR